MIESKEELERMYLGKQITVRHMMGEEILKHPLRGVVTKVNYAESKSLFGNKVLMQLYGTWGDLPVILTEDWFEIDKDPLEDPYPEEMNEFLGRVQPQK